MKFQINKSYDGWNIRPVSGHFAGQVVARAEGVSMQAAHFEGKCAVGTIRALWGAVVLRDEIYEDAQTLGGLGIGGSFEQNVDQPLMLNYDGFLTLAKKVCRSAKKLRLMGDGIFAKGIA